MGVAVGREFRAATHCVWSVFICRNEFVCVGRYSYSSNHQKKSRSDEESLELYFLCLVDAETDQQCVGIDEDDNCEILCDLDVVGLDLHAEGESKEGCAQYGFRNP